MSALRGEDGELRLKCFDRDLVQVLHCIIYRCRKKKKV